MGGREVPLQSDPKVEHSPCWEGGMGPAEEEERATESNHTCRMSSAVCVRSRQNHVRLFVTPGTIACQALLPWGFSGKNAGKGCHFLLQGIFQTQGLIPGFLPLLHWQADSLPLSHLGHPSVV